MGDATAHGELFPDVSAETLRHLALLLRGGHLTVPFTPQALLGRASHLSQPAVQRLTRLSDDGIAATHLALLLDESARVVEARRSATSHLELVWTGPEARNAHARDTAVVAGQLFLGAMRSVLVSTFVVHQGADVFEPLARRMRDVPELETVLFVHIPRATGDQRHESELLRAFTASFAEHWPWSPRPRVYYDPRSLSLDPSVRATWHAKCVVVDDEVAFVTSANFTEWAHTRNVEAGVLVRQASFARQLRAQFMGLIDSKQVARLPGF